MSLLSALQDAPGPAAAVALSSTHIAGARFEWHAGQPAIAAHAVEPLAPGALVASLTAANIIDHASVGGAFARVMERIGGPRRIALVVPDVVAKVSLVKFEQVPPRAVDLEQLIRWQMRKTAPFPIDGAQLSYVMGQRAADGQEFVVSVARRDVIEEYEQLAAAAGAHAGIVDLATLNVVNAVLAGSSSRLGSEGDCLVVHVAADYATLVVLRGPHVILFRNRAAETDGTLADVVHQTTMYYEDRLGGEGFSRVILAGTAGAARPASDIDSARRSLQERLATPVDTLDLRATIATADRSGFVSASFDTLTPVVGVLLRGQEQPA